METREVTITEVKPEFRPWGESGADITLITDAGACTVTTNQSTAPKLIEALAKLVGQKVSIPVEQTQHGRKVDKDFRFPGDPRKGPGDGKFKGKGDWATAEERAYTSASIVAQVAAKIVGDHYGIAEDYAAKVTFVALAINEATDSVRVLQKYPAKKVGEEKAGGQASAPKTTGGPGVPDTAGREPASPTVASSGAPPRPKNRTQELINIGGDSLAVVRAKRLLRDKGGSENYEALDDAAWAAFTRLFAETEAAGAH
jgi:hypothetical protein